MLHLDLHLRRGGFRRHVRIVEQARVVALAGPSGAGKTSVLHAIAGLVRPESGRIEIDGRVLYDSAAGVDVPTHRRRVGYVFQDARLFPHLDVRRNLLYGRHGGAQARFGFDAVVHVAFVHHLQVLGLQGGEGLADLVGTGHGGAGTAGRLPTWRLAAPGSRPAIRPFSPARGSRRPGAVPRPGGG